MSKHCTRCGTDKPRELFNKNNRSGDGLTQWCKPCYADYRRENRDHRIAYNREYRATQQLLPSKRARRTPEEVVQRTLARERARDARRRQARDCHWLSGYRARCRKRGVDPVVKPFTLDEFFEVNPDACCRCGDIYWELDHKIPIAAGGHHSLDNVQPLCRDCNARKGQGSDLVLVQAYRDSMAKS